MSEVPTPKPEKTPEQVTAQINRITAKLMKRANKVRVLDASGMRYVKDPSMKLEGMVGGSSAVSELTIHKQGENEQDPTTTLSLRYTEPGNPKLWSAAEKAVGHSKSEFTRIEKSDGQQTVAAQSEGNYFATPARAEVTDGTETTRLPDNQVVHTAASLLSEMRGEIANREIAQSQAQATTEQTIPRR